MAGSGVSIRASHRGLAVLTALRARGVALTGVIAVAVGLALTGQVAVAQDAGGAFRPACELVDDAQMSDIIGTALTSTQIGGQYCVWEGGPTVYVSLTESGGIGMMRMVLPEPTDLTIAGRDAVSSPGDAQTPASVLVALDDGGALMAQVTAADGVPSDPVGAAVAIAEAAFVSGPVVGRPASEESGPALGYAGEICDLVTLEELRTATGDDGFSTAQADMPDFCSYSKDDFSGLVTIGLIEGELFRLQSGDWVDLTIAGRPAVWSSEMLNSLNVDIGGGRLLQIGLVLLEGEPDRLQAVAAAVAEMGMGRLAPIEAAPTQGG